MDRREALLGEARDVLRLVTPRRWGRFGLGSRRGASIVEVAVAMLVGSFVVLGVEVAWWNSTKSLVQGTSQLELQRDAALFLESLADRARVAASFVIDAYGGGSANQVILRNAAGAEVARFYWNGTDNKLYWSTNGGTAAVLAPSAVQSLSFSGSGKQLGLSLVLQDGYAQTAPFATTVLLRN